MIQRLQTLFFFLVVILNAGVFFTPIYRHAMNDPEPWIGYGLAISLTVATLLALISVFFYKNRIRQLKWVKTGIWIQVIALGFATGVVFSLGGFGPFLWQEALSLFALFLSLILFWQAGRFIKKDENLVKSMDRIR